LLALLRRFAVLPKSEKLAPTEVAAFEAARDIGAEILQSIKDIKAGKGKAVLPLAIDARAPTTLSQSQFANTLDDTTRPL